MGGLLTTILSLVQLITPSITSSSVVQKVVEALVELTPVVIDEAQDLIPEVKAIIASLSTNPATTSDQLAALKILDEKCDAEFDAAAAAAIAEDGEA